ncbi:hypothetical protein [Mangrovimonas futianensis]|uniref:hypothetical protein n=1 Tax=Mangrovimonas futianensis TaxID=2895523 RepID=UPI001E6237A6|nr:hypothetical protein [Mangrovimonas futianensis]MCF1420114.1 hypothetical protein [Mangrovimonas futianensis]
MKQLFPLIVFFLIFNCKPKHQITKSQSISKETKFTYVNPIYTYSSNQVFQNLFNQFEKSTNKTIDSLFQVDSNQYRIVNKSNLTPQPLKESDITSFFESIREGSVFVPEAIKLETTQDRHPVMFISISPKAEMFQGKIPLISDSKVEIAIVKKDSLIFYDYSSSGTTLNKGFRRNLLTDLNKIYSNLN